MSQRNNKYETGQIYIAFIKFEESNRKGKMRPVAIFQSPEDNKLYACKITSQIDKKMNQKYGYLVKDWRLAGLTKPSIIKCNRSETYEIEPLNIRRKIGTLSNQDIKGMLIKMIKVQQMERRKEKRNEQER